MVWVFPWAKDYPDLYAQAYPDATKPPVRSRWSPQHRAIVKHVTPFRSTKAGAQSAPVMAMRGIMQSQASPQDCIVNQVLTQLRRSESGDGFSGFFCLQTNI